MKNKITRIDLNYINKIVSNYLLINNVVIKIKRTNNKIIFRCKYVKI